jgi:hypothetical protein
VKSPRVMSLLLVKINEEKKCESSGTHSTRVQRQGEPPWQPHQCKNTSNSPPLSISTHLRARNKTAEGTASKNHSKRWCSAKTVGKMVAMGSRLTMIDLFLALESCLCGVNKNAEKGG